MSRQLIRGFPTALLLVLLGCSQAVPTKCQDPPGKPTWTAYETALDISDDGNLIVCVREGSTNRSAGTYLLDRSKPDSLEFIKSPGLPVDWFRISPDGKAVAYCTRDLFVYERGTGLTRQVTSTNGNAYYPSWDPTSRYLAYSKPVRPSGTPDSLQGSFILDTVTGAERWLSVNRKPVFGTDLFWSPDGKRLAYNQYEGANRRAWILDLTRDEPPTPVEGLTAQYQLVIGWFGADEVLIRSSESRTGCISFWSYRLSAARVYGWPIDLNKNMYPEAISRSGEWMCYTDLDSTSAGGVLFVQKSDDKTGATRRQVTSVTPYIAPGGIALLQRQDDAR